MERLNGLDAAFVYVDGAGWPLHLGALAILDPSSAPTPIDETRVRELFADRLASLPVYRHRLVRAPGGLDQPVWVEDPAVDLSSHIHGAHVAPPGTDRQLAELVATLCARPIDLRKPVWEKFVIGGLEDGRVGILDRLHHSAVDGRRGIEIQVATYDLEPVPAVDREGEVSGAGVRVPGRAGLLVGAAGRLATMPLRATSLAGHLALGTGRLVRSAIRGELEGVAVPFAAPRTPFNRALTSARAFAYCSLPLPAVKRLAHREGVTVNDVILTLTGGALRRYLDESGALPSHALTAVVPVGLMGDPTRTVRGNHLAITFTSLGTDIADSRDRLHAVAASATAGKRMLHSLGRDVLREIADVAPPVALGWLASAYGRSKLANVHPTVVNAVVSSVRGSPLPLYFAGARLESTHALGPLFDGVGLNVTVLSYVDSLDFGIATCPDMVEDPWRMVEGIRAEARALHLLPQRVRRVA